MSKLLPRPSTTLGRTIILMFWCVICFLLIFGFVYGVSSALGCQPNEAGTGICMLGPVNIMTPLSMLGFLGGAGLFLVGPLLIVISLVSGLVCIARRRW